MANKTNCTASVSVEAIGKGQTNLWIAGIRVFATSDQDAYMKVVAVAKNSVQADKRNMFRWQAANVHVVFD